MIVEFRVGNFRSILDEQVLSFEADEDRTHRETLLTDKLHPEDPLLPAVFVYGANASGKSNICRALSAFRSVATQSATRLNRGEVIPGIVPFRLTASSQDHPSYFGAIFLVEGVFWDYEISCTASVIASERLRSKSVGIKPKWSVVFERTGEDRSAWKSSSSRLRNIFESVRNNASILSRAASDEIHEISPVYDAIKGIKIRVMADRPRNLVQQALESCRKYPEMEILLAKAVSLADIPVDSIQFERNEVNISELPEELRPVLNESADQQPRSLFRYGLNFVLSREDGKGEAFSLGDVSDGTVRLLALLLNLHSALKNGYLLVMDEFDASLHSLLAEELRNILNDTDLNPKGAQFIAITHNDSLLDSDRLRRDQIVLLSRGGHRDTQWYSMAELDRKPKPNESFQKRYLGGGYGGVPRVGDLRSLLLETMEAQVGE